MINRQSQALEDYKPIYGKTYSLFGKDANTGSFYQKISALTDEILSQLSIPETQALEYIQSISRSKRKLKTAAVKSAGYSALTDMLHRMDFELAEYVPGLQQHLKDVSFFKNFSDKELLNTREQYYLNMVEFELVNRIHKKKFQEANFRIALLPYCLKETQTNCQASLDEIDYACRGCLKTCYINRLSKVLRDHGVNPYILSRGSLKSIFKKLVRKHDSIGVLGIACLVELIHGMRFCMKANLPVMGIPLNANRCPRWMGGFFETSVDIQALEKILN
jgi:hypothetical protein